MAAPGSTHYGYYIISYEFVYVGNVHGRIVSLNLMKFQLISLVLSVRNALIIGALFSVIMAIVVMATSVLMIVALRKVGVSLDVHCQSTLSLSIN